jgi:hypothetical protein
MLIIAFAFQNERQLSLEERRGEIPATVYFFAGICVETNLIGCLSQKLCALNYGMNPTEDQVLTGWIDTPLRK